MNLTIFNNQAYQGSQQDWPNDVIGVLDPNQKPNFQSILNGFLILFSSLLLSFISYLPFDLLFFHIGPPFGFLLGPHTTQLY